MKILVVCENYHPHVGGAEVVLKNIAEGFVKEGHQVTVVTHHLPHTAKEEIHNGVTIKRVASANSRYLFSFTGIWHTFKEARKNDIVQATTFNGAFPAWIASVLRGKPVVLMVHELWIGRWKKITGFSWIKSTIHDLLERCIYLPNYDAYVAVSDATRRDLLGYGITPHKVQRIHNGFDDQFWHPQNFAKSETQQIRTQYTSKNDFLFLAWGRPGASKGFETLIDAMQVVSKAHPHAKLLLLLGSKDSYKARYDALCQRVKDKKLNSHITIHSSVPYAQLGNYILAADCAVVPSLAEGFGYTTLEASSLGKPVIVSNAGSLPEVVGGKHRLFTAGSVTDLAKAMEKAMEGEFVTTPLQKFPWSVTVKQYLTLYERLLKR